MSNCGTQLKNFLVLDYNELEKLNLEAKRKYLDPKENDSSLRHYYISYLNGEDRIKAVTICFSDLEGRFHTLDYDKKFLLNSYKNLTFDGSSVNGFTQVNQSDLRLEIDWGSFRWLPSDIFGPGKVIIFGLINDRDGTPFSADIRSQLKVLVDELRSKDNIDTNVSVECEGFLFEGLHAEQRYQSGTGFNLVSTGGYFNSLPRDPLKLFIDAFAEAKRSLGFENEKDHPEVAPSQFELNYKYCDALVAADQLQLYKLVARQLAANMGMSASFLPKPVTGINGNGMHCNISLSKNGQNLFYDKEKNLSKMAYDFIDRILSNANDLALILNSSVNAFRRMDPNYEAPNQIKFSANDRTSMVRIPLGDEKSTRIEVRTVAPDSNPYLVFLALIRTGLSGPIIDQDTNKRPRTRFLPDNIHDSIRHFKSSDFISEILGQETKDKYLARKQAQANRCPRELGTRVKESEIKFHHEVTNQLIWSQF